MAKNEREKALDKVARTTTAAMKALQVYKKEFIPTIRQYAEMTLELAETEKLFDDMGRPYVEPYTNKGGNENLVKSAIYTLILNQREELRRLRTELGLTPKALRSIKNKDAVEPPASNPLISVLESFQSDKAVEVKKDG